MNKLSYAYFTISIIQLFSIGILCYTTNSIGSYYIHNYITENIFMDWVVFYTGLIIFCITLFVMNNLKMKRIFMISMAIVAVLLSSTYVAITIVNFKIFDFNMEYYYMPPITSVIGLCMCIVWSYMLPFFHAELIITNYT